MQHHQHRPQVNVNTRFWKLDQWDKLKHTQALKDAVWRGIPSHLRSKVWKLLIHNNLALKHTQFEFLRNEYCTIESSAKRKWDGQVRDYGEIHSQSCLADPGTSKTCCFERRMQEFERYIELDLPRTFPDLMFFANENAPLWQPLKQVLLAFSLYRPDIGYVQGMSYIGALMLMNQDNAGDAFIAFSNVICSPFFSSFFRFDSFKVAQYFAVFDTILLQNLPRIHSIFKRIELSYDLFLYEWFLTMFTKSLQLDTAIRVWDNYFLLGTSFLFKVAVGILHFIGDHLSDNFESNMIILGKLPKTMSDIELFGSIKQVSIRSQEVKVLESIN